MGVSRNGPNSGQSHIEKKLERKSQAGIGVERAHGGGNRGREDKRLACK